MRRRDGELGGPQFFQMGKLVDADQRRVAGRDRPYMLSARRSNFALDQVLLECGGSAAGRLDLLKERPGGAAKLLRQAFGPARAGGRVGDALDIRLVHQNELSIARDPSRKAVG